jgi:hypothetical protein
MKDNSKEILAAAIGIAAGSALGILLSNIQKHRGKHREQDSSCRGRKRERLLFVKGKMEMHRERLEKHLARINEKLETLGTSGNSGTATKEHTLLKPDPALI